MSGPTGPVRLRPAQRRLLSILLLEPRTELARDALIDRMWGEWPPPTAVTALHVHAAALRRSVAGLLVTTSGGYRLRLDGWEIDRAEFEQAAVEATEQDRAGDWPAVLGSTSRAVGHWRGRPFDDLEGDDFAFPEINRLSERRLDVLELRARALAAVGESGAAVALLQDLAAWHPLRESVWLQLIAALDGMGRRAEALRTFQQVRRVLAEELGVEPVRALRDLEEAILAEQPGADASTTSAVASLPPATTSFIGREQELGTLTEALGGERLVTVVGGPGVGKTRFAVEAARLVAHRYPAGMWLVSLAETRHPEEVLRAVAAAMGVRRQVSRTEQLLTAIGRSSPVLLILDNCEHQRAACADLVARLRGGHSELRILLTSRQALGIDGETVLRLEPLSAPSGESLDGKVALSSSAVMLFVDRARAVDRTFRLTDRTARPVAELCRRAGGIPLALELAARWVHALSLDDIGEMLAAEPPRLPDDGPERHGSLAAAFGWSLALLPAEDRRVFRACSIFNGRFSFSDIADVCAPGAERRSLARGVARLAEASLLGVEREPDGAALYQMLTPIRDFAREQLAAHDHEWQATRERFATRFLRRSYATSTDQLRQVVDLEAVDRDLDNLRAVIDLGLELGRADVVVRLVVSLDGYMLNRYLIPERMNWLHRALQHPLDPLTRARALRSLGSGAQVLGELDESLACFGAALPIFRASQDVAGLAQGLLSLSGLHAMRGEWRSGIAAAEEARPLAERIGSVSGAAIAAYYVGENLALAGDTAAALPRLTEAARMFGSAGEIGRAAYALATAATYAALSGEEALARQAAERALALAGESGSRYRRVRALGASAIVEARYGDEQLARRMLVDAQGLLEPYEMDDVFQFLLPAAFALRRGGLVALLRDVLGAAEDALAQSPLACPRPWRAAIDALAAEVASGARAADGDLLGLPRPSLDEVVAAVVDELSQPAAA